jgi:acetoacetyl-CoA synthetase
VLQVELLPRTLSGKLLEVPVKRILMGAAPKEAASVDSLADPRSLDYFIELARTLKPPDASGARAVAASDESSRGRAKR